MYIVNKEGEEMKIFTTLYDELFNTKVYEGTVKNGEMHGHGTLFYPSLNDFPSVCYNGEFNKGKFHGFGTLYDREGNIIYEGCWYFDLYQGFGRQFNEGGYLIYEGKFYKGIAQSIYGKRRA